MESSSQSQQSILKSSSLPLKVLLWLNSLMLLLHFHLHGSIEYFAQLTIISQLLVILNFYLSLTLHQQKSRLEVKLMLSRLHLVTLGLEGIVVIGFWGLRVFFSAGIIGEEERSIYEEILSIYLHGGSFITMLYFAQQPDCIISELSKRTKYLLHLMWGIPYLFIQFIHFYFTKTHIYPFISTFSWLQLAVFELGLYFLAVSIDYFFTARHGYQLRKEAEEAKGH